MLQTKLVHKIKTNYSKFNNFFPRKQRRIWDNVGKCNTVRQATDGGKAHAHSTLDNWSYKNTLRIRNTYCFSTATMLAQTRLNITLYVRTLPVFSSSLFIFLCPYTSLYFLLITIILLFSASPSCCYSAVAVFEILSKTSCTTPEMGDRHSAIFVPPQENTKTSEYNISVSATTKWNTLESGGIPNQCH